MKKLFATILLGAIAVSSVCAFTACNPEGEEGEGQQPETVETQVTEDEWKTALSYFMVDADFSTGTIGGDYPRINFSCVFDMGEEGFHNLIWSVDYDKNLAYSTPFGFSSVFEQYVWEESGKFYYVTALEGTIAGEEITESGFSSQLGVNVFYAGGAWISQYDLLNKYGQFTYSEETAEYTGAITYTDDYADGELSADVTLKFENGKLAYFATTFNDSDEMRTITFTYTYGITLTVPDEILNFEAAN